MKDLGEANFILGIKIERATNHLRMAALARRKSVTSRPRAAGGTISGLAMPIGAIAKMGTVKTKLTTKRLRMSRAIAAMSMPAP